MTNREAIEVIERFGVDSRGYPKLKEALEMAIKALEKQAKLEELMNMGAGVANRMYKEGNADDE